VAPDSILTQRLTLVPATHELLRADARDRPRLARLVGCQIPVSWPQALWGGALNVIDGWLRPDDLAEGWGPWYILLRDPPTLIGTVGFKGRPDLEGTVEIGYGVADGFERQGYTPEAVAAAVEWAWGRGAATILAHTFERHTASVRVLEKCGFRLRGPGFEEVDENERRGMGELILFARTR
jgi:[ribosomal protein S5]-alanine N-acetyltransferase